MTGSLCATVKDLLGDYNIGNKTMFVNWDWEIFGLFAPLTLALFPIFNREERIFWYFGVLRRWIPRGMF
jgi:hypothetical protein